MFGIIADFFSSILTILLPAYLSYKALRTSNIAQITPWLIYFIILSLALLFESWTLFIIGWFPFYSWIRLFFLLYLVLPQTQGAKILYLTYVEPFIVQHEHDIDVFIGETHHRLEGFGLGYLNLAIDWLRDTILGQKSPASGSTPTNVSAAGYATNLLSRFTMPAAGVGATTSASNVYGMLSGVAGAAMGGMSNMNLSAGRTRDFASTSYAHDQPLIPENMHASSPEEKSRYLAQHRERLSSMLHAIDKEQQSLDLAYGAEGHSNRSASGHDIDRPRSRPSSSGSGLGASGLKTKSRSEVSFEQVDYDSDEDRARYIQAGGRGDHSAKSPHPQSLQPGHPRAASGSAWYPSSWWGANPATSPAASATAPDRRAVSGSGYPTGGGSSGHREERKSGNKERGGWSSAMDMTDEIHGTRRGADDYYDR